MASLRGHLCVRVEISTRFLGVKLSDRMIGGSRCQSTVGLEQSGAPQAAPSEPSAGRTVQCSQAQTFLCPCTEHIHTHQQRASGTFRWQFPGTPTLPIFLSQGSISVATVFSHEF